MHSRDGNSTEADPVVLRITGDVKKRDQKTKVFWSLPEGVGIVALTTYTDPYLPPFRGTLEIQKV
jgi:hypothetical protein